MEPGERLRRARLNCGLTVEQLAARVDRAPTTVRAHENGQNGIRPAQAARYAKELKVSAEWILYGTGEEGRQEQPFRMEGTWVEKEVVNFVSDGKWMEEHREREGKVGAWMRYPIAILPYCDFIYQVDKGFRKYSNGSLLLTRIFEEEAMREGDHVVVRRLKGGFVELTLYEILSGGPAPMVGPLAEESRIAPHRLNSEPSIEEAILGVVVGDLNPWRRQHALSFPPT